MEELGGLLGYLAIAFYALTVLNYIIKFLNRKFKISNSKNKNVADSFKQVMKFHIKYHHIFGFVSIALILVHFALQAYFIEISITGIIAAAILLLQVFLGAYGKKVRPKSKTWLNVHRVIAVILFVTILIHIV